MTDPDVLIAMREMNRLKRAGTMQRAPRDRSQEALRTKAENAGKSVYLSFTTTEPLYSRLEAYTSATQQSAGQVIHKALSDYLDRHLREGRLEE